ncbi:MAG: adenine phosphoribosyltransferase [bacterium]
MQELANLIRSIPDFPKKGILFRDITTLLKHGDGFRKAIKTMVSRYTDADIHKVVCIEARGFLLGAPIAYELGCGVVPIRKPGKLPYETIKATYQLEYGTDAVEIHKDSIENGERVLIVDDLLATGGTTRAAAELVERLGGKIVGIAFLIELSDLNGRKLLDKYEVFSVIKYQ